MTVFFITLFSFFIFSVPVVLGIMGAWVFIVSGLVSLFVMGVLSIFLERTAPKRFLAVRRLVFVWVGGSYFVINILYFANIIPPIPLALKDSGVYHHVTRTALGSYEVLDESRSFLETIMPYRKVRVVPGEPVYAWSAVFAPTKLSTTVLHRWQYFDEEKSSWVTTTQVPFTVSGGRDGGYRGYSLKTALAPGKWRVDVITPRGQVVGRMKFVVEYVDTPPALHAETK